ncbi:MAG: sulfite exporter TauE/SafE family protein [Oscillospiraceae bacterium]|nr:sulfite exporter TauE/SafE family protein [Oscillospiraceae bacterium]
MPQSLIYFAVSFLASVAGAICGIGGGVIIKPVLDLCALAGVSTISFLSGCTVLSMSCYSVGRNLLSGGSRVDFKTGTPLAIGAAVGGVVGKQLFGAIRSLFANPNTVGAVQAACLAVITAGTLAYTVFKSRIKTHRVDSAAACVGIGLALGITSSFLGIGGGPINLVVLFYFFSMDTKTAAQNSLYIILFSQITSLLTTLVTRSVPEFAWGALALMVCGGIGGGMAGRAVNKRMDNAAVDKLFMGLMVVIILISISNTVRYSAG